MDIDRIYLIRLQRISYDIGQLIVILYVYVYGVNKLLVRTLKVI